MRKFFLVVLLCSPFVIFGATSYGNPNHNPSNRPDDREPEFGPVKMIICQGESFDEGYNEAELLGGAYNAWCYNAGGEKVAKIHHDAPFPSYIGLSDGFYVYFTHYNDKNRDGELEDREADGFISMFFTATPQSLKGALTSGDFTQGVVAVEVNPEDDPGVVEATGWFKGTAQVLSRTNIHLNPIFDNGQLVGAKVDFVNFSVLSFAKKPVPIVR